MRLRLALACVASGAALGGCAIRPAPEDVASIHGKKLDTVGIVREIRCEIRDAIQSYALQVIQDDASELSAAVIADPRQFKDLQIDDFGEDVRIRLGRYDQAAIVYEFNFDMTVSNKAGIDASLTGAFDIGTFGIGAKARNDRDRQNIRSFRVFDTFWELATVVPDRYCEKATTGVNRQYPIAGDLGLDETIGTFLTLNQSGNLFLPKEGSQVPTLADTILFTTNVSGSISPGVTIEPVGARLGVKGPGFDLGASRKDIHKLILVLTLPPDVRDPKVRRSIAIDRAVQELEAQKNEQFRSRILNEIIDD